MKKAQAATEYLIVLAVVIIIALIVIGVMGGIPGIGAGAKTRASQAYWNTADVAITSYAISEANGVTLNLKNNMRNTIDITAVTVAGDSSADAAQTLVAGASGQVTIVAPAVVNTACTEGDAYSHEVIITYTDSATGASYPFNGDGTQLEGTCAT